MLRSGLRRDERGLLHRDGDSRCSAAPVRVGRQMVLCGIRRSLPRHHPMKGLPWLVLPTYNEAENLERLVHAVQPVLAQASPSGHRILVVDDDSPDGTGQLAEVLSARDRTIEVLHRAVREGLGPAYLAGFHHALQRGAGRVIQMDADFSHDPQDVATLLAVSDAGADLVLGSRYVPGGGVTQDWSPVRRAISQAGCWYARTLLGV